MATSHSPFWKTNFNIDVNNESLLNVKRITLWNFMNCSVSSTPQSLQRPLHKLHRYQSRTLPFTPTQKNPGHKSSINCIADNYETLSEKQNGKLGEEIPRATLIWRAIKLPMYTVAFIPVTVGTAAAYWQTGLHSSLRYFTMLASYILIIAWVNLSNDVYDFDTGADINKKESVVNLFGGRARINFIAWLLLAIGFAGLTWVAIEARNSRSIILLASAVFGFLLYQCPPFRLSYYGLGEPLGFIVFGPLSTIAFYLLHSTTSELPISSTVVWASVLVGLTTSLILFCSHFHQIEDDKAVGKMSPLVRLGTERSFQVVKMAIVGLYSALLGLGISQTLPLASIILCAMTLPMGNLVVSFVQKNHKDKSKIFISKYLCVRLHTLFGVALAAGLVATRMFAGTKVPHVPILSS